MEEELAAFVSHIKLRNAYQRRQQGQKYPTIHRDAYNQTKKTRKMMRHPARGQQPQYHAVLLFRKKAQRKPLKLSRWLRM